MVYAASAAFIWGVRNAAEAASTIESEQSGQFRTLHQQPELSASQWGGRRYGAFAIEALPAGRRAARSKTDSLAVAAQ